MKKILSFSSLSLPIIILLSSFIAPKYASATEALYTLPIAIWGPPVEIFKDNNYKVPCRKIKDYIKEDEKRRDIIDLLIFCQAFNQANLNIEFELMVSTEYQKAIRIAKNDFAKSVSFTVWKEDINPDNFYYSQSVIRRGEYQKGLYTLPEHKLQSLAISDNPKLLKQYAVVTVKNWVLDNQAAAVITDNIALSSSHKHLFSMIKANRADFTLLGFGFGDDMLQTKDGISLKPIPGVKISFNDSRHFIIKKTADRGSELITALNLGLAALRNSGYIQKLYRNAGLYKEVTSDWLVLNPPAKQEINQTKN